MLLPAGNCLSGGVQLPEFVMPRHKVDLQDSMRVIAHEPGRLRPCPFEGLTGFNSLISDQLNKKFVRNDAEEFHSDGVHGVLGGNIGSDRPPCD